MINIEEKNSFFNKTRETMDLEKRNESLEKNFLETFKNAYQNSKTYREIYQAHGIELADIKGLEDIERLPVIHISDIVDRQKTELPFGGFETTHMEAVGRIYINPGFILQPGPWDFSDTTWAEALSGTGFKRGDRIVNTFNYHMWPFAFMLDESAKMIDATTIPTGVGNTMMQIKIMQRLKVNGIIGTPSFIMTLAQRAESMGLDVKKDLFLETAMVSAEMLPESLRAHIENKLGITVRQAYGTVFLGCIGYECMHMMGLHVPDNIIVEVIDPQTGKQVKNGGTGEIVETNFNKLYPMLRMATGDLSKFSKVACPCGRTGPVLEKIFGRIDQATKVKGTFIHPWQVDEVVSRYHDVFKYQLVITRENHRDEMTLVVELNKEVSLPDILCRKIERDLKSFLTLRGIVKIVSRGTIPDFHKKIEDKRSWD